MIRLFDVSATGNSWTNMLVCGRVSFGIYVSDTALNVGSSVVMLLLSLNFCVAWPIEGSGKSKV